MITNSYHIANEANWIIGRLKDSVITQSRAGTGINTSSAHFEYNAKGQMIKESVAETVANKELFTRHIFDSDYGNEIMTITCSNHTVINCDNVTQATTIPVEQSNQLHILNYTKTIYDSDWHLYVEETKAPFGSAGNSNFRIYRTCIDQNNCF